MIDLVFTPHFFATILATGPEKIRFGLIVRSWNDGHEPLRCAALAVDGVERHAFDIEAGEFIPLGDRSDSTVEFRAVEPAVTETEIRFEAAGYTLPMREFRRRYASRVVHASLR